MGAPPITRVVNVDLMNAFGQLTPDSIWTDLGDSEEMRGASLRSRGYRLLTADQETAFRRQSMAHDISQWIDYFHSPQQPVPSADYSHSS